MKIKLIFIFFILLSSCTSKKQLLYLNNASDFTHNSIKFSSNEYNISSGDILKIEISSIIPEAVVVYNKVSAITGSSQNLQILQLEGYLVDNLGNINFPVLGKISTKDLNINQFENKLARLLIDGNHLTNPIVKVRRLNSKFTVLGEVRNPGTFSFVDEKLNVLQALGYAGDLTINGKRQISLVRENDGLRSVYEIDLTNTDFLNKPLYEIKNNDIIIVKPNFSQVKSAGFIGSPASIASIASLILSITLLIINK